MGKNARGHKEFSKEQELKHENRELRKENERLERENRQLRRQKASSRKQFARMDLDRHSYVREIVEEHLADEQDSIDSTHLLAKMKAKWLCRECHQGHLEILVYSKMGNPWYYRQCSECPNRTKSQPHHANVEGPLKPIPEEPVQLTGQKKSFKGR